jgi:uncharacterized protein
MGFPVEKDPRLLVDVDALDGEGWSFHDQLPEASVTALLGLHGPTDVKALAPLVASLTLHKIPQGVRLDGTAQVTVAAPCARCLAPAPAEINLKIGLTLFPGAGPVRAAGDPSPPPAPASRKAKKRRPPRAAVEDLVGPVDEDVETGSYQGGVVDVAEILREHVLLELPMALHCRPGCRGLCPSCGADLNQGPCSCPPSPTDPRLAALAHITLD